MLATDNNLRKKSHHPHYLYSILSFRNFQACNLTNKETFQKCFYRTQKQSPGSRQENNCARAPFLTRMQAEACIFTYWHWRFPGNFENYLSAAFLIEYLRWLLLRISSRKLPLICLRKDYWTEKSTSLYYFLLVFSEVVTRRCSAIDLKLY